MRPLVCVLVLILGVLGCEQTSGPKASLKVAVTTSTRDSGLLDVLLPPFEKAQGVECKVLPVGTGKALKLGENGDVDVVLVHAEKAELAFMKAGHGSRREALMYNSFLIVGPPSDPAGIKGKEPRAALALIARGGHKFISRGDDSGTHKRELQLWGAAKPKWKGSIESGRGMGATLIMAYELKAYTLCDQGTFLKVREKTDLVPLVSKHKDLRNPYGVMAVNAKKHPGVKSELAERFLDYLISKEAQTLIANYRLKEQALFVPLRLKAEQR